VTGKPVDGYVFWRGLPDNPNLKDYGTVVGQATVAVRSHGNTRPDGSFELTAVPGPGLLLVRAEDEQGRYRRAADADEEAIKRDAVKVGTHTCATHAIIRVSPSEKKPASLICNIALEPGVSRKGTVLGPDGKPLAGALAGGVDAVSVFGAAKKLETADFTITGLHPKRARTVMFYHNEKKLAAVVQVKGDEKGPVKVRLAPLTVVTGRLVDAKGQPVAGAEAILDLNRNVFTNRDVPLEFLNARARPEVPEKVTTDDKGNFRIAGLVPGTRIDLFVPKVGFVRGLYVKPNAKTVDLGDVKLGTKE